MGTSRFCEVHLTFRVHGNERRTFLLTFTESGMKAVREEMDDRGFNDTPEGLRRFIEAVMDVGIGR